MQKITIVEAVTKITTKGHTLTTITDDKGAKFSSFEESARLLAKGDIIEADVEVKGEYINLVKWQVLTAAVITDPGLLAPPAMSLSEIRLRKAEMVCQLWIAGKLADDHPLVQRVTDWLSK